MEMWQKHLEWRKVRRSQRLCVSAAEQDCSVGSALQGGLTTAGWAQHCSGSESQMQFLDSRQRSRVA